MPGRFSRNSRLLHCWWAPSPPCSAAQQHARRGLTVQCVAAPEQGERRLWGRWQQRRHAAATFRHLLPAGAAVLHLHLPACMQSPPRCSATRTWASCRLATCFPRRARAKGGIGTPVGFWVLASCRLPSACLACTHIPADASMTTAHASSLGIPAMRSHTTIASLTVCLLPARADCTPAEGPPGGQPRRQDHLPGHRRHHGAHPALHCGGHEGRLPGPGHPGGVQRVSRRAGAGGAGGRQCQRCRGGGHPLQPAPLRARRVREGGMQRGRCRRCRLAGKAPRCQLLAGADAAAPHPLHSLSCPSATALSRASRSCARPSASGCTRRWAGTWACWM